MVGGRPATEDQMDANGRIASTARSTLRLGWIPMVPTLPGECGSTPRPGKITFETYAKTWLKTKGRRLTPDTH